MTNDPTNSVSERQSSALVAAPQRESGEGAAPDDGFKSSPIERWMLRRALKAVGSPPVTLELWDGESVGVSEGRRNVVVRIRDRQALWRILVRPATEFAEMYSEGRVDVNGDLIELMRIADRNLIDAMADRRNRKRLPTAWHRPRRAALSSSRRNIHHHYDIGNDFYRLWLDKQLLYTCAYFPRENCTLEEAQVAKMDHVGRKLWLRPGDRVIEAGSGWGAFALHLARHYGVTVRAYNISAEQIHYSRERARAEGLASRVEFIEDDWRNIAGTCDAFVSIGMLEHVGVENFRELGAVIDRCLARDGRGLIHSIGRNSPTPLDPWTNKRIFPGARPPALSEMAALFEPYDFSILDIENLRLHYARTLRNWLERYEASVEAVRAMFDDRFVRMWRLYLAASVAAFEAGSLQLFQVTFARGSNNDIPRTRASLYVDRDELHGNA